MTQLTHKLFTDSDRKKISDAVHDAEKKTSGEIVPYVVDRSDAYEDAEWRAAMLFGAGALTAFGLIHRLTDLWLPIDFLSAILITLAASLTGALLVKYLQPLKRLFAGHHVMERRVHQRAAEAFVAEEVFNTRDRTGILLFISLLEHIVLVVGDSGINAKVEQHEWDGVVQLAVQGMKDGKPADGIASAIAQCGSLLQKEGIQIRPDDADELSDDLRIRDR